jgi:hypothetical protein
MPKFTEAGESVGLYLMKNLKIDKCARDEIRVLTWTIDTAGNMVNIDVPSIEGECRQKIIEQLKAFPKWKPGRLKGKPVCVKMYLRICIKT